jgi:hypothetical protein
VPTSHGTRVVVACVVVAAVVAGLFALASRDGKVSCTTELATSDRSKGTARHVDEAAARRRSVTAACSYDCAVTLTMDSEACVHRCEADVATGAVRAKTICDR